GGVEAPRSGPEEKPCREYSTTRMLFSSSVKPATTVAAATLALVQPAFTRSLPKSMSTAAMAPGISKGFAFSSTRGTRMAQPCVGCALSEGPHHGSPEDWAWTGRDGTVRRRTRMIAAAARAPVAPRPPVWRTSRPPRSLLGDQGHRERGEEDEGDLEAGDVGLLRGQPAARAHAAHVDERADRVVFADGVHGVVVRIGHDGDRVAARQRRPAERRVGLLARLHAREARLAHEHVVHEEVDGHVGDGRAAVVRE